MKIYWNKSLLYFFCFFWLGGVWSSCQTRTPSPPLFELKTQTGVNFNNVVKDNAEENSFQFRNFYNGGGIGIGDLNHDGLPDLVFTANQGPNKIYINQGNFKFKDISATSGIKYQGEWSTGVSLVDIDHDGWLDIYICHSGHVGTQNRKNELYRNNHDLTFTECAAKYGLDHSGFSTQAVFFDYDRDGDLDCLIIDNSPIPFGTLNYAGMRDAPQANWKLPDIYQGGGNHLFRNDHGHYTEVTQAAGIHTSPLSFGLGVTVSDLNGDGYPDIYVGNDFLERDYMYINQKDGTFKDELTQNIKHCSMSSMGTDIQDMNNDGYPDIYTTDMFPESDYRLKTTGTFDNIDLFRSKIKAGFYHQYVRNCLQINSPNQDFKETGNFSGVSASDWSWGLVLWDADNDGFNDIYVCNGINRDLSNLDFLDFFSNGTYQEMMQKGDKKSATLSLIQKIPKTPLLNKAYKNLGNLKFEDIGTAWGFTQPSFSNSVAYADLNNDGALDLVVNNENQPAFIYENHARNINQNNFLGIQLNGPGENTYCIGAKIKVYLKNQILSREIEPIRGFQSSVDYKQIIGLGKSLRIDSIIINWPNFTQTKIQDPTINKVLNLNEPIGSKIHPMNIKNQSPVLFKKVRSTFQKHHENDYVDFYQEANIPEMLSREGPKSSIGDLNGDGLDDIYIGGAMGQLGQVYIQDRKGGFKLKEEKAFLPFNSFEETCSLLLDADGDGDLDLFIGSGGNNHPSNSRELQHRLYINDGKGNFKLDPNAFPSNNENISVAAGYDIDGDGDLDLFVGSRSSPMQYGVNPQSHFYLNDGKGHFKEMDLKRMGALGHIGMVTDAKWIQLNSQGPKSLLVVGDWMSPRIFDYVSDHFVEASTNLSPLLGLWRTIIPLDFNRDGKMDFVIGNIGENFYLHPDAKNPVKLWINDFDQNSNLDKVLTYNIDGKDMPIILKNDLESQLPSLKKENLLHEDYAKKSIQDLFSKVSLENSLIKTFNYPSSVLAINLGNGKFQIDRLPDEIQFSSVNTGISLDLNGDGFPDLILGGNDFNFLPQFGRLDASTGDVLINNRKGGWNYMPSYLSGIWQYGEARDLKKINIRGNESLLWLENDNFPSLYGIERNSNSPFKPQSNLKTKTEK